MAHLDFNWFYFIFLKIGFYLSLADAPRPGLEGASGGVRTRGPGKFPFFRPLSRRGLPDFTCLNEIHINFSKGILKLPFSSLSHQELLLTVKLINIIRLCNPVSLIRALGEVFPALPPEHSPRDPPRYKGIKFHSKWMTYSYISSLTSV